MLLVSTPLAGCAHTIVPLVPLDESDEPRIWVLRDGDEVYRCADGSAGEAPPRPLCVRAELVLAR